MFASITDDQVTKFLRLQAKRRVEDEYWAYDSSSISSYSETLNQVQWGRNKEDDKHLLEDLDILGFGKTKFVMDRGFYSEDNINGFYREHVKFLVGVRLSLKFIKCETAF